MCIRDSDRADQFNVSEIERVRGRQRVRDDRRSSGLCTVAADVGRRGQAAAVTEGKTTPANARDWHTAGVGGAVRHTSTHPDLLFDTMPLNQTFT